MKDEIKEIKIRSKEQQALDDLKSLANAKEDEEVYIEYGLNTKARILLDYITNLEQKVDRLLKTQEMYEKKCNKIHQYIIQNCEIIRHKDYDEVGKVNGGHILTLLAGGDEE